MFPWFVWIYVWKVLQSFWLAVGFSLGHSVCLYPCRKLRCEPSYWLVTTWGDSGWCWEERTDHFKTSAPLGRGHHRVFKQTRLVSPDLGEHDTSTGRWDFDVSFRWQSIQPDVPILSFRNLFFPIQWPSFYMRNLVRLWIQLSKSTNTIKFCI